MIKKKSRQVCTRGDYNKTSSSSSSCTYVLKELRKLRNKPSTSAIDALIKKLEGEEPMLKLGPYPMRRAASGSFTIENALIIAHELAIPEKFVRPWFAKQKALGWKDSYQHPVRSLGHWLSYCWRIECDEHPGRLREQGDLVCGGYADYAKDGKNKPAKILPIPRASDDQWKTAGAEAKRLLEEFRKQHGYG